MTRTLLRAPLHSPGFLRQLSASVLCVALIVEPAWGAAWAGERKVLASPGEAATGQIQGTDRVLHALDRLTFGPRPGEVAEVQKMGLSRWFEGQLRPGTIDDSALEARLARFPAMALPQEQLFEQFPSPQMLRQMIATDAPLPTDPLQHALYADQIAFYKAAKAKKEAAQPEQGAAGSMGPAPGVTSRPADVVDAATMPKEKSRRPDLLRGTSSPYQMGGKKAGAETSEAASMATDATASGEQASALDGTPKGRQQHAEAIFPEAETLGILRLAPDLRVQRVLSLPPEDLVRFRKSLSKAEVAGLLEGLSPRQMEILASLQGSARLVGAEVLQSRLERDVYSQRQLQAVMTDFWLNHFNVYLRKNQNEPYLLPAYERETIRPRALGKFEDLLAATAQSPAMLVYLDNWQSIGPESIAALRAGRRTGMVSSPQLKQAMKDRGLNENYARELMELHTVGVGCEVSQDHSASTLDRACGTGYTQADVTEVAKVFSGWTIEGPNRGGLYRFDERRHQPGAKMVLGRRIGEAGEDEGREVLHLLATSPATAKFISTKLAVRFVSDTPPPSLVAKMTQSFLTSDGDISAVLRTMFAAPEFWSPAVVRAKVKTPLEFMASALRASNAEITTAVPLVQALDRLGMPLYGMQTPNGYSWMAEPWVSTGALVTRMNFALVLSSERVPGTRVNFDAGEEFLSSRTLVPVRLLQSPQAGSSEAEAQEERLEMLLLGRPAGERTRAAVLVQAERADMQTASAAAERDLSLQAIEPGDRTGGSGPAQRGSKAAMMAGLLLGSPEFQRR